MSDLHNENQERESETAAAVIAASHSTPYDHHKYLQALAAWEAAKKALAITSAVREPRRMALLRARDTRLIAERRAEEARLIAEKRAEADARFASTREADLERALLFSTGGTPRQAMTGGCTCNGRGCHLCEH